jgi:hypothetical protein
VSWWQLPLQQSHEAVQDMVLRRHTSPSGLQPMGLRQMPTVLGGVMVQVTGEPDPPGSPADPQQSVSVVHRSPTGWQPLAGWQTRMPLGPQGAQRRLQHAPPQAGSVPASPRVAPPMQIVPSGEPQLAVPAGGWLQVP